MVRNLLNFASGMENFLNRSCLANSAYVMKNKGLPPVSSASLNTSKFHSSIVSSNESTCFSTLSSSTGRNLVTPFVNLSLNCYNKLLCNYVTTPLLSFSSFFCSVVVSMSRNHEETSLSIEARY